MATNADSIILREARLQCLQVTRPQGSLGAGPFSAGRMRGRLRLLGLAVERTFADSSRRTSGASLGTSVNTSIALVVETLERGGMQEVYIIN